MKELKVVRGHSVEDNIRSIDGILSSNSKKGVPKILRDPQAIPISCCPDSIVEGQVLVKFLFPYGGTITSVVSQLKGVKRVLIDICLSTLSSSVSEIVQVGDGARNHSVDVKVESGDLLVVKFIEADMDKTVDTSLIDLSMSLLFIMDKVKPTYEATVV